MTRSASWGRWPTCARCCASGARFLQLGAGGVPTIESLPPDAGQRMARPGLEPGTPRFSGAGSGPVTQRETPGNHMILTNLCCEPERGLVRICGRLRGGLGRRPGEVAQTTRRTDREPAWSDTPAPAHTRARGDGRSHDRRFRDGCPAWGDGPGHDRGLRDRVADDTDPSYAGLSEWHFSLLRWSRRRDRPRSRR
jgi:hypothetical protein